MSQLSETFPTLDCSQCILTPRMVEAARHPRITLHTWCELEKVEGYIGNFKATIRKKARSVNEDLCNGCGDCQPPCPSQQDPRASSTPDWASAPPSTCPSRRRCPTSR